MKILRLYEMARTIEAPMIATLTWASRQGGTFTTKDLFNQYISSGGGNSNQASFVANLNRYITDPRQGETPSQAKPLLKVQDGQRGRIGKPAVFRWGMKGWQYQKPAPSAAAKARAEREKARPSSRSDHFMDALEDAVGRERAKELVTKWKNIRDPDEMFDAVSRDIPGRFSNLKTSAMYWASKHMMSSADNFNRSNDSSFSSLVNRDHDEMIKNAQEKGEKNVDRVQGMQRSDDEFEKFLNSDDDDLDWLAADPHEVRPVNDVPDQGDDDDFGGDTQQDPEPSDHENDVEPSSQDDSDDDSDENNSDDSDDEYSEEDGWVTIPNDGDDSESSNENDEDDDRGNDEDADDDDDSSDDEDDQEDEFPIYLPDPDEDGSRAEVAMYRLVKGAKLNAQSPFWEKLKNAKNMLDADRKISQEGLEPNLKKFALTVAKYIFDSTGRDWETGEKLKESRSLRSIFVGYSNNPERKNISLNEIFFPRVSKK